MATRDTPAFGVSEEKCHSLCFNFVQNWFSEKAVHLSPHPHLHDLAGLLPGLICQNLSVEQFRPGHLICTLVVVPQVVNHYGTLHGGAMGGLVELIGCAAIKSVAGPKDGVVSDINISYIKGSRIKEELVFEANVLRVGRSVGVATVNSRYKKSGKSVAQGRVTMCFQQVSKL